MRRHRTTAVGTLVSLVLLAGAATAVHATVTMRAFKTPIPVAAFTLKANATSQAIIGAPGDLLLGRVAPAP